MPHHVDQLARVAAQVWSICAAQAARHAAPSKLLPVGPHSRQPRRAGSRMGFRPLAHAVLLLGAYLCSGFLCTLTGVAAARGVWLAWHVVGGGCAAW